MAISDDIQRYMPSIEDRVAPRCAPLAYKEAVLLVDPVEPQFKGEVDDKYQYSLDNKDNTVPGWISGGRTNPAMHYWSQVALGKALNTLGKDFTECRTRQRPLGKKMAGKATFAEC